MTAIQHLLFDIGQVLLRLDYDRVIPRVLELCDERIRSRGAAFFTAIRKDPALQAYERGELTAEAYFEAFRTKTGFSASFETFISLWRDIFSENEPMIAFGRELADTYPVYFMSNAGDLHVPYAYEAFPSLRFFTDDAISCYLHAAKPDRTFYEKALAKFDLQPETCLFIDDQHENVAGAQAVGIKAIQYTDPEKTIRRVRALL